MKILFITKEQFGYLTDTFKYCQYLKKENDITYISFDQKLSKFFMDNVKQKYVKWDSNQYISYIRFLKYILCHLKNNKYDKIMCVNFRLSFVLGLFYRKKIIFDIRTVSISPNKIKRKIANLEIKFNSLFFKNKTVITSSAAKKLGISNYMLLPLGADRIVEKKKVFLDEFNLLYIGTLYNRRIEDTIIGVKKFAVEYPNIKMNYFIIGDGLTNEKEILMEKVKKNNLTEVIHILGRKDHEESKQYFEKSMVGISYVPLTDYYDVQPPTKTFEYLMNDLICIATETSENKKIITKKLGVLCKDNPESFKNELIKVYQNRESYYKNIIENSKEYSWKDIVKNNLKIILGEN